MNNFETNKTQVAKLVQIGALIQTPTSMLSLQHSAAKAEQAQAQREVYTARRTAEKN